MGLFDAFSYKGKRALVVGGATGMGAAVAELVQDAGAEVVVMDRAEITLPGVKAISLDLSDKASIDAAVAECGGPVHALFSCAGVADGTPGIERVNFIGHRHLIDRLLDDDLMPSGSAIGFISSAAGLGWENSLAELHEYLDVADFDEASQWAQDHGHADYMWSKKTINAYVGREAFGLLKRGIRINAILPGPTDTPLARANEELWLGFGADYRAEAGVEASTPLQQAYPLVFLCSDAADGITGITIVTDAGYFAAGVTGSYPPAQEVIGFLRSI
jgi:NAD(P)-dependent dehydrogenase (short-subunit alcohol dehydrogenase family)